MKRRGPRSDLTRRRARSGRRRVAFAAGLAGAALAGPGAPALAAPTVDATIFQSGAPRAKSLSVDQLTRCPPSYSGPNPAPLIASPTFQTVQVFTPSDAWSVGAVLDCLGVGSANVQSVEVQRPTDHTWEDPLTGGALAVGAAGEAVPVIFSGDFGATISYYRPPASSTDYNAGDEVPNVDTLSLNVLTGRLISVTIRPGSETVAAGTAVSFTAVDDHGSPFDPRTDSTTWAVDGGPPSPPSPSFSQTFSNGEHTITAVVSDGQGGGGAATVQITVGRSQSSTPGSQDSNSPGNTQQPGAPAIGPQQSAGTVPGGAPGARNPRPSPATSKATTVRHAGPTPPKKVTAAAPKPRPVAPTPLAAPSPNTGAPVAGPRPSVAPGRKVPLVSGRLIGNVTLLRPDQSPLVKIVASNATAPPVQRPTRTSILPGLAGALAVLVLLALGAGHQLRWRLRPIAQLVTG